MSAVLETLRQKQSRFAHGAAELILKAFEMGYEVTLGEALRTREQAEMNARAGTGTFNSLHILKLAIDLNLFKDGRFLETTDDHRPLGEWWESQGEDHRWGGRFKRPDGNHYSFEYEGRA